ncbi:MAG: class I SAM-dependent methyltransferase [Leptospirillia bacterium]
MTVGPEHLKNLIREEIESSGPIPFSRFMEMALYTPKIGYYTGPRVKIGKQGDFFTSLDVHPVFGRLIGAQVIEMARELGDAPFTVVEMGAGKGLLAYDILRTVQEADAALFDRLHYAIVEISPDLVSRQQTLLEAFSGQLSWHADLARLGDARGPVTGVFVSNELLDSLPHHQVIQTGSGLKEVFVGCKGERFVELYGPPGAGLSDYLARLGIELPEGYRTELNLRALDWTRQVAERLDKGYVLTIDYGYPAEVYYRPDRKTGTFLCYHGHKVSEDPYARVGQQDMTAHVDFTSVARAGAEVGLVAAGFTDQAHFLVGLGISGLMQQVLERDGGDPQHSDEFCAMRRLVDPNGMGKAFKVLLQAKSAPSGNLSGFHFSSHSVADLNASQNVK